MTYHAAFILFDMMGTARKHRVVNIFEQIRLETGFPDVHAAFIAAVEDECKAIETEKAIRKVEGVTQ